jgi:autotransporter-associated beta strand protein
MNSYRTPKVWITILTASVLVFMTVRAVRADFLQTGAGPYDYNNSANWDSGNINGVWSRTLTANQVVTFGADTVLGTGWTFNYGGNYDLTLKGTGGDWLVTLGGDISASPGGANNRTVTIGSTTSGEKLNISLGANRIFTVSSGDSVYFYNIISGEGYSITKAGPGILRLYGASTFSGGVNLSAGGIFIGGNSTGDPPTSGPLGTGTFTMGNGTAIGVPTTGSPGYTVSNSVTIDGDVTLGINYGDNSYWHFLTFGGPVNIGNTTRTLNVRWDTTYPQHKMCATFSGVISGSSGVGIIKQGLGALRLSGANTFDGGVTVNQGMLIIGANSTGNPVSGGPVGTGTLTLKSGTILASDKNSSPGWNIGNPVVIDGNIQVGFQADPSPIPSTQYLTLSGPLSLAARSCSLRLINSSSWPATDTYLTISGAINGDPGTCLIVDAGSRNGSLTISSANNTFNWDLIARNGPINLTGSGNMFNGRVTAAGGSITVSGSGNTFNGKVTAAGGSITVSGSGNTFNGKVTAAGGSISVNAPATFNGPLLTCGSRILLTQPTFGTNASVTIASTPCTAGVLGLGSNVLPPIASSSSGVLAINTTGFNQNLESLAGTDVYLGSTSGGTNTSTSLPTTGGAYLLGGGGGTLTLTGIDNVLTGTNNLIVGRNGGGGDFAGTVQLNNGHDFTGTITVNRGSTLIGVAQAAGTGKSPFGSTTNNVILNGGTIGVTRGTATSAREDVKKGQLTWSGRSVVSVSGVSGASVLFEFNSLNRGANAVLALSGLDAYSRIKVTTNPPTPTNGMVDACFIIPASYSYCNFLTYGADGFTSAAGSYINVTNSPFTPDPGGTQIVLMNVAGTINPGTIHALLINDKSPVTIAAGTLNITSGGISLFASGDRTIAGGANAIVNAGDAEAIFHITGGYTWNANLAGNAGVTIASGRLNIDGNTPAQNIFGKIRLFGSLSFYGGGTFNFGTIFPNITAVVLNGGNLSFGGGGTPTVTLPSTQKLEVGELGGLLTYSSGTFNIGGAVEGSGLLSISGGSSYFNSGNNTYSGGTRITSGSVYVSDGSSLGTGPVEVAGPASLYFYGNCTIDSLWGAGTAVVGPSSGSGTKTLTIGDADNRSCTFSGVIRDYDTANNRLGALTKVGTGTFTLWGASTYTGSTTVNGGTLLVNGSLETATNGVTVASGATLGGIGTIKRTVTVQDGAMLAPGDSGIGTLSVVGNVSFSSSSTNLFELGSAQTAECDKLDVTGNLTLGGVLRITKLTSERKDGSYEIMSCSGSLSGSFSRVIPPEGYKASVSTEEEAGVKKVIVTLSVANRGTVFAIW